MDDITACMPCSKLVPVCFFHLNFEMIGSPFKVDESQIPFRIGNVLDLIKPRHGVANMRSIGHRLFANSGKRESGIWQ